MLQEEIKLTQFPSFKHAFKQGRTMVVVVPCDVLATVLIIHYLNKVVRHEHKSHNQDVYAENWSINCPLDCKNYSASGGTPQTPLWGNCTLAAHQWSACPWIPQRNTRTLFATHRLTLGPLKIQNVALHTLQVGQPWLKSSFNFNSGNCARYLSHWATSFAMGQASESRRPSVLSPLVPTFSCHEKSLLALLHHSSAAEQNRHLNSHM